MWARRRRTPFSPRAVTKVVLRVEQGMGISSNFVFSMATLRCLSMSLLSPLPPPPFHVILVMRPMPPFLALSSGAFLGPSRIPARPFSQTKQQQAPRFLFFFFFPSRREPQATTGKRRTGEASCARATVLLEPQNGHYLQLGKMFVGSKRGERGVSPFRGPGAFSPWSARPLLPPRPSRAVAAGILAGEECSMDANIQACAKAGPLCRADHLMKAQRPF